MKSGVKDPKQEHTVYPFEVSNLKFDDPAQFNQYVADLAAQPNSEAPPCPPIKFLAAQGGGAKGAAYLGTLKGMEETASLANVQAVAGASAGSITMFMVGLGLTGDQLITMGERLDFMDFCDLNQSVFGIGAGGNFGVQLLGYLGGVVSSLVIPDQAYLFTGENFYHWARALLTYVVGDPDITFAEFAEKCKQNPALKELTFTAYAYEQSTKKREAQQIFNKSQTPNVRVLDALRSSMAFPLFAYTPWKVYEKVNGELKYFGLFADGGITCNYPVEMFDTVRDPMYEPRVSQIPGTNRSITVNPCVVGLSLTQLDQLDDSVTPISDELKVWQEKLKMKPKEAAATDQQEQISEHYYTYKLGSVIKDAVWGRALPEQYLDKQRTHYTVQVCPLDVGVLEFSLEDKKRAELDNLSNKSWHLWYERNRTSDKIYHESKVKKQFKLKSDKGFDKEYLIKKLTKQYYIIIAEQAATKIRRENPQNNQRLKYHSKMAIDIINLANNQKDLNADGITEIMNIAYTKATDKYKKEEILKALHHAKMENYIVSFNIIEHINQLLQSVNPIDHLKALIYFEGQISHTYECMIRTRGEILAHAAKTGNSLLVESMLKCLDHNVKLLYQQKRPMIPPASEMYQMAIKSGLFLQAVKDGKADVLEKLLSFKDFYNNQPFDPLITDYQNKNAFQHAIEQGNLAALNSLVRYCEKRGVALDSIRFGNQGNTLGHYLIEHAPLNLLKKLNNSKNQHLKSKIIKPDSKNNNQIEIKALAAYINSQESTENTKELRDARAVTVEIDSMNENARQTLAHNVARVSEEAKKRVAQVDNNISQIRKLKADERESFIKNLDPQMCYDMLALTDPDGINFISFCAMHPKAQNKYATIAVKLYEKAFNDKSTHNNVVKLLNSKTCDQTPLYLASQANNAVFIRLFLSHGSVTQSLNTGPYHCPSAFLAAAKVGATEALVELIKWDHPSYWKELWRPYYHPQQVEGKQKTLFHYLAFADKSGEALCAVLNDSKNNETKFFYPLTSHSDDQGNSPFAYLLMNPNAEIVLAKLGEEIAKWGVLWGRGWQLQDIFDFKTRRENGYTDLELALKKGSPELIAIIKKYCDPGLFAQEEYKLKSELKHEVQRQQNLDTISENTSNKIESNSDKLRSAVDKSAVENIIKGLTAAQCLGILRELNVTGTNFLCECAQSAIPLGGVIASLLFEKAYQSNVPNIREGAKSLVTAKYSDRTPLYMAACADNVTFIQGFLSSGSLNKRKYNFIDTQNAGPLVCPSALKAAAQAGAGSAVVALCKGIETNETKHVFYQEYYNNRNEGETLLHHLVRNARSGNSIFHVLNNTESHTKKDFHASTQLVDQYGNSAFYYLLENPNCARILETVFDKIAENWRNAFGRYTLDVIFNFEKTRINGYTDLEWAIKTASPAIVNSIEKYTDPTLFKKALLKIKKELELEKDESWEMVQSSTTSDQSSRKLLLSSFERENQAPSPIARKNEPERTPKVKRKDKGF